MFLVDFTAEFANVQWLGIRKNKISIKEANYLKIKSLMLIPLLFLMACTQRVDSKKVARVKENFDKIKPGMTNDEVKKLVGEPIQEGTITYNHANYPAKRNDMHLTCKLAPCSWDAWALEANPEDFDAWPIVIFDRNTHRVTQTFREELEDYFPL
jgi:hypothetical protein